MNIPEMIKESYKSAIEKGFYSEGEEKNIGELLMLIVSEIGEALEAHRCRRFVPKDLDTSYFFNELQKNGIKNSYMITFFTGYIKDTFEDEIADIFLRLFSFCGYMEIEPREMKINIDDNIGLTFLDMTTCLCMIGNGKKEDRQLWLDRVFSLLVHFSKHHNIPIEKHIKAKMLFNSTRPYKHGKEY